MPSRGDAEVEGTVLCQVASADKSGSSHVCEACRPMREGEMTKLKMPHGTSSQYSNADVAHPVPRVAEEGASSQRDTCPLGRAETEVRRRRGSRRVGRWRRRLFRPITSRPYQMVLEAACQVAQWGRRKGPGEGSFLSHWQKRPVGQKRGRNVAETRQKWGRNGAEMGQKWGTCQKITAHGPRIADRICGTVSLDEEFDASEPDILAAARWRSSTWVSFSSASTGRPPKISPARPPPKHGHNKKYQTRPGKTMVPHDTMTRVHSERSLIIPHTTSSHHSDYFRILAGSVSFGVLGNAWVCDLPLDKRADLPLDIRACCSHH